MAPAPPRSGSDAILDWSIIRSEDRTDFSERRLDMQRVAEGLERGLVERFA